MRSLRTKLLGVLALVLFGVCGSAFGWYAWHRTATTRDQAVRVGEALADALGVALAPHFDDMDLEAVERVLASASASHLYRTVTLLGRGGRVLSSHPPLPPGDDPRRAEPCAGCHAAGGPLPHAALATRGGEAVVQVFRALEARPTCQRCHPAQAGALGHVFLEVPVTETLGRLHREMAAVLGVGALAVLAILAISYLGVSGVVVRPLERLRALAERWSRGDPGVDFDLGGTDETAAVGAALHAATRRHAAIVAEISALAASLRGRGGQARTSLAALREGVQTSRGAVQGVLGAVGALDNAMEQIRANLNAIAASTSDNSTSLTQMSASIDEVAGSSDQLSQQVDTSASAVFQMVHSIVEVAEKIEVLTRETEATASSMAQIDASTRQIEENAREAAGLSGRMAATARDGSQAVQETLGGIHDSYEVIRDTARAMGELAEASKAIGGVVKIINEINDKTKLLALNAAIIAAQAGEHGKSFGVVAHEIKNLSDRTAASTGEISRIIRGIRERTGAATEAVARGQEATARSVELAEQAGRTLERILSTARVSHDMNLEILRATEEQSRGSQSVMASMQEVSAMVAYIRQAAQEHRRSGGSVSGSSEIMRDLTVQVKLATAEQAEVSRYLSDAISAVDHNLHDLLTAVDAERGEVENILGHMARLRERGSDEEVRIDQVAGLLSDVLSQVEGVEARAAELAAPEGERGGLD
ncbi:MAG: methyl-accepting chemotaxis protein [Deferrisomatales bacterium]